MERALSLYQSIGDQEGIGRAYCNLSFLYERTDPERMVRLPETAQPYAARSGDPRLQMFVQNGLGNAKYALSRATDALVHYREPVRLRARAEGRPQPRGRAQQHRAHGAAPRALRRGPGGAGGGRGPAREVRPSLQAGQVLINLGLVWRSRGGAGEGDGLLRARPGRLREVRLPAPTSRARWWSLAELHAEQGDREQAEAMRRRPCASPRTRTTRSDGRAAVPAGA